MNAVRSFLLNKSALRHPLPFVVAGFCLVMAPFVVGALRGMACEGRTPKYSCSPNGVVLSSKPVDVVELIDSRLRWQTDIPPIPDDHGHINLPNITMRPIIELPAKPVTEGHAFPFTVRIILYDGFPKESKDLDYIVKVREALRISVNLAGADISPKESQSLDDANSAHWSVKLPSAGEQQGFVHVEAYWLPSSESRNAIELRAPDDTPFVIEAREVSPLAMRFISVAGLVLGIPTTIFGLIVSFFTVRDKVEESRQKSQNEKRKKDEGKIIVR
jgi:hypothetical protein